MKTIKILVTVTYDDELWTAKGIRQDIRESLNDYSQGVKAKVQPLPKLLKSKGDQT